MKGIPAEYIAEIVRLGGVADLDNCERNFNHDIRTGDIPYTFGFDPEAAKIASLTLLRKEGVKLRLHSWIVRPMLDGTRVTGVIVESKSGRQAIAAEVVIDCTGDGDVAAGAGAPFSGPAATGDRMPMRLMYQLGGVPPSVQGAFGGIRMGDGVTRWAKPGIESLRLIQTPTCIGIRETRRINGEYTVTEKDAIDGRRFPDVIAISSNPVRCCRSKWTGWSSPAVVFPASRAPFNRRDRWRRRRQSGTRPDAPRRSRPNPPVLAQKWPNEVQKVLLSQKAELRI